MLRHVSIFLVATFVLGWASLANGQNPNDYKSGELDPALAKLFAQQLEKDIKDRPEWVDMAISMLKGEPMGAGKGWYTGSKYKLDFKWLLDNFDDNGDGFVVKNEISRRFKSFERMDRNGDQKITAEDLDWKEVSGLNPDKSPAGLMFRMLDSDTNGKVTADEMANLMRVMDRTRKGYLTAEDLQTMFDSLDQRLEMMEKNAQMQMANMQRDAKNNATRYLQMLMKEELGNLNDGPAIGDMAPEFELQLLNDKSKTVKLADLKGKIVVLNFGSFT